MDDKIESGCWLSIVNLFVVLPIIAIVQAYVLSQLWEWFIVPTFELPSLTIPVTIGILGVTGFFRADTIFPMLMEKYDFEGWTKPTVHIIYAILKLGLMLGLGWIVWQFV